MLDFSDSFLNLLSGSKRRKTNLDATNFGADLAVSIQMQALLNFARPL
jgi:hypothetical protein